MLLQSKHLYEFGNFRLALSERRLYRENEPVSLPPKEFDLLALLVSNAGQPMSREDLLKSLWPNLVVEEANLNVHVSALRKVLSDQGSDKQFIETLPRLGYRFIAPVTKLVQEISEFPAQSIETTAVSQAETPFLEPEKDFQEKSPALKPKKATVISRAYPDIYELPKNLPLLFSGAIGILLVLAVGFYFYLRPAGTNEITLANEVPALHSTPLTTYPGRETHSAFSPDGNLIAFVWRKENYSDQDIYVRLVEGGNTVQLTNHPGDDVNPTWAPHGRSLAFYRSTNQGDGIFMVPALGGAERKLTDVWSNRFEIGPHTWLHWSPQGKWIAYSDKSASQEPLNIFLIAPETGEKRQLTTAPTGSAGDCSPAFSPDGSQLAFVRVISALVGEIFIVNAEGGTPRQITFNAEGIMTVAWMPNGREIVYSARYSGRYGLFRLAIDKSQAKPIAIGADDGQYPALSAQGARLIWARSTDNTDIYRAELKPPRAASPTLMNVAPSTAGEISPRYSPDGKRIVFVSNRSGSDEIWVSSDKGENPTRLTSFRGPTAGSPSWSPDGKHIVFDCRPDGNPDIFIVSSEGGQPRRLTTDSSEDIVPSWSSDGNWIYFTSQRSNQLQIWKVPVSGGTAIQITKQGGFEPVESPDGQWIYYTKDRGSSVIWRVPVEGGEESFVFDLRQKNYSRLWTITEKGIWYLAPLTPVRAALRAFNFSNRTEQTFAEFDCILRNGVTGLSRAPDGSTIIFPVITQRGSDLMMVEGFH